MLCEDADGRWVSGAVGHVDVSHFRHQAQEEAPDLLLAFRQPTRTKDIIILDNYRDAR